MSEVKIYTDGGSRGNPGEGAIGFVVLVNGQELTRQGYRVGWVTNNQAEYQAVLAALDYILENNLRGKIDFYLDSQLIARQLAGEYKVKDNQLKILFEQAKSKIDRIGQSVCFSHIKREENKIADSLVNKALDG